MQINFRTTAPARFCIAASLVLCLLFLGLVRGQDPRGQDPVETIRIDSDLVDLKVSVIGAGANKNVPPLEQKDFVVLEDGEPQAISFFEAADAPFDLVLLLDLSGSNSKNLKMIRNSAKRFVEATRPTDRVAIVSFTDQPALYSSFTLDRAKLKKSIDMMDDAYGGTNFWDSLNWVVKVLAPQGSGRRNAVVVMTDGVDNALPDIDGQGSRIDFNSLLENIRNSDTIVFPIYLDTEAENVKKHHYPPAAYAEAREQLASISAACATPMYRAAKLADLDQVYAQVVHDLSTVYSIGYRPSNKSLDGKWRSVEVRLVEKPDLLARTKRGYYAKLDSAAR
ncbi:MAG TPA: VWA domain-containing protein [Pyrinomonadaceae bacterium]|jgi:VWFA-related protein|nr:VWA domain-containing protein [Pyrinomonadaceae bacterium]